MKGSSENTVSIKFLLLIGYTRMHNLFSPCILYLHGKPVRPPFDHVSVNQSFMVRMELLCSFLCSQLALLFSPHFSRYCYVLSQQQNILKCFIPFLMHAFRQPKTFQDQKPNMSKKTHGSKLISTIFFKFFQGAIRVVANFLFKVHMQPSVSVL